MTKAYSMESELAKALVRFSFGRITSEEARKKAKEVVPNFDSNNEVLAHKGINWFAKELLKKM
jgi:cysteine sulfinate desulfinase/cysteine desulfurase-like protein